MFLLSNSEEFKDTTNIFGNNQKNEDKYEKDCHNIFYSINLLGDLPQHEATEERDFNSLLDKVIFFEWHRLKRLVQRQTN